MSFFRIEGLDKALADIRSATDKANMTAKVRQIAEDVSKPGIETARKLYMEFADDGELPTVSDLVWTEENKAEIVAEGDCVGFVEFGTGVYQPPYPDSAIAQAYGAIRGEYGKKQGRRRSWIYYGEPGKYSETAMQRNKDGSFTELSGRVRTYGEPPSAAMYKAAQKIREELEKYRR